MATLPSYAATAKAWAAIVPATADTSTTAPTNTSTLVTAGASGSKIEQIRVNQLATLTAPCTVYVFLHDGTTHHLLEAIGIAGSTVSTTNSPPSIDKYYANLVIPVNWSIRVSVSVAAGQSNFKVLAFGGDF